MRIVATVILLCVAGTAVADGEEDAERQAIVARMFDTKFPEDPQISATFSAFTYPCGAYCDVVVYGGCCESAKIGKQCVVSYQGMESKLKLVVDAESDDLAPAQQQLLDALQTDSVRTPDWFQEHRFDKSAKAYVTRWATFKWNWKKKTLTVISGKKKKTIKAPRVDRGYVLDTAAVWYLPGDDNTDGSSYAVLRITIVSDDGAEDRMVSFPIPE